MENMGMCFIVLVININLSDCLIFSLSLLQSFDSFQPNLLPASYIPQNPLHHFLIPYIDIWRRPIHNQYHPPTVMISQYDTVI